MEETLKEIFQVVAWYRSITRQFNDIETLISSRRRLSTLCVDLATFTGDLKADFEAAYFNRKLQYARAITKHKSGKTAIEAEALSIEDIKAVYEDEKTLAGQHEKAKLILKQVNEVLSSMQQQLAYLKDEKKTESIRQPV